MVQDSARSVSTKRRFASFARRPGSAAFGACRWTILLIICTKQNPRLTAAVVRAVDGDMGRGPDDRRTGGRRAEAPTRAFAQRAPYRCRCGLPKFQPDRRLFSLDKPSESRQSRSVEGYHVALR